MLPLSLRVATVLCLSLSGFHLVLSTSVAHQTRADILIRQVSILVRQVSILV